MKMIFFILTYQIHIKYYIILNLKEKNLVIIGILQIYIIFKIKVFFCENGSQYLNR